MHLIICLHISYFYYCVLDGKKNVRLQYLFGGTEFSWGHKLKLGAQIVQAREHKLMLGAQILQSQGARFL